ncbi:MAG: gliding motility-associated C-terminal domain-containing protein, partial [Bacteroidota bacterium]|nr:gliding motility-associated C-terminal domain-containing protein [Bacteroidota bacterium]
AYAYIKVYKNPIAYAGTGKVILLGDTLTLNGIVQGTSINYYWTPPQYMDDPQSLSPKVSPVHDMQYTLHTISNVGCGEVASSVLVKVYDDIFIPNAFTPNGDGKNDVFHILALDSYRIVSFLIYDREGKAVYRGTNTSAGWDGTYRGMPQPVGTYIYYLELQNQQSGKKVMKKGTILLLR